MSAYFLNIIEAASWTWWIVLPFFAWRFFDSFWQGYIGFTHAVKQEYVILELISPRELEKSPKLMERVFEALAATDKGMTQFEIYCTGHLNPYFSCELVGRDGRAHLYIRTPVPFRNIVETNLYGQYPDIELREVEDYVNSVPQEIPNKEWTLWGADLALIKPDAFPIRTYKYFQEDVTGNMIDPLAAAFELCTSTVPGGQQIWLQWVIQATRPSFFADYGKPALDGFLNGESKSITWFQRLIHDIKDVAIKLPGAWWAKPEFEHLAEPSKEEQPLEFRLTPGEKETLKALEFNLTKSFFSVKARLVLVGRKDDFPKSNITAMFGMLRQFSDTNTNALIPEDRSKTYADYFFTTGRLAHRVRRILERYRDRDDEGHTFHMSTEELATVFHLPDQSVRAPGVAFVDAQRSDAPGNLPIQ